MTHHNEQAIRETAYYLWLDAGKPNDKPDFFWYQAITKLNPKGTQITQIRKKNKTR